MNTSRTLPAAAAAAAVTLLAACSSGGTNTPTDTAASPTESATPAPAGIEAPFDDLDAEVTDHAGVLGDDEAHVQAALDQLSDTTHLQLFVTYVGSFGDLDGAAWANATANNAGLGKDDILLAVAVTDRHYGLSVDNETTVPDDVLTFIENTVVGRLEVDDWSGAPIAAVNAITLPPADTVYAVTSICGGTEAWADVATSGNDWIGLDAPMPDAAADEWTHLTDVTTCLEQAIGVEAGATNAAIASWQASDGDQAVLATWPGWTLTAAGLSTASGERVSLMYSPTSG